MNKNKKANFTTKSKFNNLINIYPSNNSIQTSTLKHNFKQLFTINDKLNNKITESYLDLNSQKYKLVNKSDDYNIENKHLFYLTDKHNI